MTKEKQVLNPKIEYIPNLDKLKAMVESEKKNENIDKTTNVSIDRNINVMGENNILELSPEKQGGDSLFAGVIDFLRDKKNLSSKTELIDEREVFIITKMDFLGNAFDFPSLQRFTRLFKENRISLKRKGRQEMIMAMQERRQEIERQQRERTELHQNNNAF